MNTKNNLIGPQCLDQKVYKDPFKQEKQEEPKKRDRLAEVCEEPKAPLADPWEPITPQETDERAPPPNKKRAPKPIKRGRTTKLPPGISLESLKAAGEKKNLKPNYFQTFFETSQKFRKRASC